MIGQFFILSPRGDVIINKDFRGDAHANMHDTFFRKVSKRLSTLESILLETTSVTKLFKAKYSLN